jgi:hypothetical protein
MLSVFDRKASGFSKETIEAKTLDSSSIGWSKGELAHRPMNSIYLMDLGELLLQIGCLKRVLYSVPVTIYYAPLYHCHSFTYFPRI